MSRILITGCVSEPATSIAKQLLASGHLLVGHANDELQAAHMMEVLPTAESFLIGDISNIAEAKLLATKANDLGSFDIVIHCGEAEYDLPRCRLTRDGLPLAFAANALAPYILTALMRRPRNITFLGSRLHLQGRASLRDLHWRSREWDGRQAYFDSKLFAIVFARAIARLCSHISIDILFYHDNQPVDCPMHERADDIALQSAFIAVCKRLSKEDLSFRS